MEYNSSQRILEFSSYKTTTRFLSRRDTLVQAILKLCCQEPVIAICVPSESGKTKILKLLCQELIRYKSNVEPVYCVWGFRIEKEIGLEKYTTILDQCRESAFGKNDKLRG